MSKIQKKKYQKFDSSQEAVNTNTGHIKNLEKDPLELFDFHDFPALRIPEKFSSERKNFKWKNREKLAVVSYGVKKPGENFVTLSPTESNQKNELHSIINEKQLTESELECKSEGSKQTKKAASVMKSPSQVHRNPHKKKRRDPIILNLEDILTINEIQKKTKQSNLARSNPQKHRNNEQLSGNLLDSSSPKRSRGKHREINKKKISNFKMTIIKERILKQKMREKQIVDPQCGSECLNLIDTIDFKKEINVYLNELSQKNLNCSEINSNKSNENSSNSKIKEKEQENAKTTAVEKIRKDLEEVNTNIKEKKICSTTAEGEIKFSSKFREYCDNIITPDLNAAVTVFIQEIIKLQDRLFSRDPIKAKAKRRHVAGLREVKKYLTLKKVKIIIIAPNLEKLQMEGSIYDSINQLKSMAQSQNVPYGFALDRHKLGKCTKKYVPISAFAVLNYEGIETLYGNVMFELLEAKRKFSELLRKEEEEKVSDINSQIISSIISSFRDELRVSTD